MNRAQKILVAVSFGIAAVMYRALPDPVPTHFDLAGRANGWMPKPWGVLVLPMTTLVLALLFSTLRRIRGVELLGTVTLAFTTYLTLVVLAVGAGHRLDLSRALFGGTGVLLAVLGNFLGKLRRNGLVGIRTPWTLGDDEVWLRTHRAAGPIFVLGGALLVLEAGLNMPPPLFLVTLLVTALIPAVYSYFVHRQLHA